MLRIGLFVFVVIIFIAGCGLQDSTLSKAENVAQDDGTVSLMNGYAPDAPVFDENEVSELGLTSTELQNAKVIKTQTFSNGETFKYMVIDGQVIEGDVVLGSYEDYQGYFREYEDYLETGDLPDDLNSSEISTQGAMAKPNCRTPVLFACFERWGGGWPGGIVYYDAGSISSNFVTRNVDNIDEQAAIYAAMREFEISTDLQFRPATSGDRIVFKKGSGCSATLGRSSKQPQAINLATDCFRTNDNLNPVLHEIGHAVGLIHEHQRYDRVDFISVEGANIKPAFDFAIGKRVSAETKTAYDVDSLMHYPASQGSDVLRNPDIPVFRVKPGVTPPRDGDFGNDELTARDIEAINQRY